MTIDIDDPHIRVFVIDDHPMIRAGLAGLINGEKALLHVGDAASGEDALQLAPTAMPDVLLVDLVMPGIDGIATIAALKAWLPDARFVVLTSLVEPAEIRRAMDAGANGYVLKTASAQELVSVIHAAHAGRRVMSAEATDALIGDARRRIPGADLTTRERELLGLMARGLNNQEIGTQLGIAVPTVKFHITHILAKLHANNRTEAVLTALKFKLVPAN